MGDGRNFLKSRRASLLNDDLSNEHNLGGSISLDITFKPVHSTFFKDIFNYLFNVFFVITVLCYARYGHQISNPVYFLLFQFCIGQCCGSGMFIPDPGSASKNLSILTQKNGF
jgi:hypothetical protein